jgi:hypothetical protein
MNRVREQVVVTRDHPSTGRHGIAVQPPPYGIDFVDRRHALIAPAPEGRVRVRQPQLSPAALIQRVQHNPQSLPPGEVPQLHGVIGNRAGRQLVAPPTEQPRSRKKENHPALPDSLKAGMETLSGVSRENVHVPYDSPKPAQVQALAYPQGMELHVGPGQEQHLPHETWHVVQQKLGRVKPPPQAPGAPINEDTSLEHEAEVMGAQALQTPRAEQVVPNPAPHALTQGQSAESRVLGEALGTSQEDVPEDFLSTRLLPDTPSQPSAVVAGPNTSTLAHRAHENAAVIQRAVGFEFEDGEWASYQVKAGASFRRHLRWYNPRSWYDRVWTPSGTNSGTDREEEKEVEQLGGVNVYAKPHTPETSANAKVEEYNLEVATKKGNLHSGKGYEIQPDGPYNDEPWGTGRTDIEFVTDPFEENESGYQALVAALDDMQQVQTRLDGYAPRNLDNGEFVWPSQHQFTNQSIYLAGGKKGGRFKVQATSGIPLAQMADWLETIGTSVPGKRSQEAEKGQKEMQARVYGSETEETNASKIMGEAPTRATTVMEQLRKEKILGREEDTTNLHGFLSLVLMYLQLLADHRLSEGIKGSISWLARFSFAAMFTKVPKLQQEALATNNGDDLVSGIAAALTGTKAEDLHEPMMLVNPIKDAAEWKRHEKLEAALQSFSRRDWVLNILKGKDLLMPTDLLEFLSQGEHAETATTYEKSLRIFQRGHGNASNVKDTGHTDLHVFEHREIDPRAGISTEELQKRFGRSGKELSFAEARTFALAYHTAYREFRNRKK